MFIAQTTPPTELVLSCGEKLRVNSHPHQEFVLDNSPLSSGRFSSVFKAYRRKHDRSAVAFKIFAPEESTGDALLREVSALAAIGEHPNIVPLLGVFAMPCHDDIRRSSPQWALCFDFIAGSDLFSVVKKNALTETDSRDMMLGVLRALDHIHSKEYIHRDVTPENVLLSFDGTPVLADFGSCTSSFHRMDLAKRIGNPDYIAPEIWCGELCSAKSDIFSAGVMLHFALSGKLLFSNSTLSTIMRRMKCNDVNISLSIEKASNACKSIVGALLQQDPTTRLTASRALEHEWLSQPEAHEDSEEADWKNCHTSMSSLSTDDARGATLTSFASSQSLEDLFVHPLSSQKSAECSNDLAACLAHPLSSKDSDQPAYTSLASSLSTGSCSTASEDSPTPPAAFAPTGKKPFFVRRRLSMQNIQNIFDKTKRIKVQDD